MPEPTRIIVVPSTAKIKYDYRQDLAEIQDTVLDTHNPYGLHASTTTQGFMRGGIKIQPEVKLNFKTVRRSNSMCLWYETIKIEVEIDPTIVIAKEVSRDRCMKAAVLEHEHKHIRADREIVNKYARETADKVYATLKEAGFIYGPIPLTKGEEAAGAMYERVFDIIRSENREMERERAAVQAAIDSKEEYDRVAALCPDFNPARFLDKDKRKKRR